MPSPTEWAYLAGIIDGEGYVGRYPLGKGRRILLEIGVVSTDLRLTAWLKEHFGGYTRTRADRSNPLARKPLHIWRVRGQQAEHILEGSAPFRLIK